MKLTKAYNQYGASMGRAESNIAPKERTVRVYRIPINQSGYDSGGAYWGIGRPLYCAEDGEEYCRYTRAYSRDEAIKLLFIDPDTLIKGMSKNV